MHKLSRAFAVIGAAIIGLGMSAGVVAQSSSDTDNVSITVFSGALSVQVTVGGFNHVLVSGPANGNITMNVTDGRPPGSGWYVQASIGAFDAQGPGTDFSRPLSWSVSSPPSAVQVTSVPFMIISSPSTVLTAPTGGSYTVMGTGEIDVLSGTVPDTYVAVLTTTITGGDPG